MSTATQTTTIVSPAARQGSEAIDPAGGIAGLDQSRIAVIDISKIRSDVFADAVEQALDEHGAAEVERFVAPASQRMDQDELARVADGHDAAVLSLADCGTCTSWSVWDAIELHRAGCRAVLVTIDDMRDHIAALAPRLGLDDLPLVAVAKPNRDMEPDEIRATASGAAEAIAAALRGD